MVKEVHKRLGSERTRVFEVRKLKVGKEYIEVTVKEIFH